MEGSDRPRLCPQHRHGFDLSRSVDRRRVSCALHRGPKERGRVSDHETLRSDGDAPQITTEPEQSMLLAISNEMVRVYKDQFGRGPTKTRTSWAGPDVLTVVLEDTLTRAERNLVRLGEHQRLRDLRMFFQYAEVDQFCGPVERITGRKVRGFISGIDTHAHGLATEMFVLHPDGYDGPSRIEYADT